MLEEIHTFQTADGGKDNENAIRQWHTIAKNVPEHLGLDTPGANEIPQRDRKQWVGSTFLSHLPETFTVLQTAKMHPSRQPAKMLEHQDHTPCLWYSTEQPEEAFTASPAAGEWCWGSHSTSGDFSCFTDQRE